VLARVAQQRRQRADRGRVLALAQAVGDFMPEQR